ncbi:MAG: hypothetical protein V4485_02720 [Pseudomonadota bacterium]
MNLNHDERNLYEDHLKWMRIEANTLKKSREEGKIEARYEIAKNMLASRMSTEGAATLTGLSLEEVERLLKI